MKTSAFRWFTLVALLLGFYCEVFAGTATQNQEDVNTVGGFPISSDLTSMWLGNSVKQPFLMVYFHGQEGWHNTKWDTHVEFADGKPGWAEFKSSKAALKLWLDPKTRQAEVQSGRFNIRESNTFLVLHVGEVGTLEKIVPLGVFDLLPTANEPASVLLLRTNRNLIDRINKEIVDGARR